MRHNNNTKVSQDPKTKMAVQSMKSIMDLKRNSVIVLYLVGKSQALFLYLIIIRYNEKYLQLTNSLTLRTMGLLDVPFIRKFMSSFGK